MALVVATFAVVLFGVSYTAFAHPGKTDSNGGHHCWTNCAKWGYSYGSYHYHNGGLSGNDDSVLLDEQTLTCGDNQSLGTDNLCYCDSGYFLNTKKNKCEKYNTTWCQTQFGKNISYDKTTSECVCKTGYVFDSKKSKCVKPSTSWCKTTYGKNISYDKTAKDCVCGKNYSFDSEKNKCVKTESK